MVRNHLSLYFKLPHRLTNISDITIPITADAAKAGYPNMEIKGPLRKEPITVANAKDILNKPKAPPLLMGVNIAARLVPDTLSTGHIILTRLNPIVANNNFGAFGTKTGNNNIINPKSRNPKPMR